MPKPIAWLIISALAGTWIWLIVDRWRDVGWTGLLFDAGLVVIVAMVMAGAVALSLLVGMHVERIRNYVFPRSPPWEKVRSIHQNRDPEDYKLLVARLEKLNLPTPHERISIHQDRETGQLWERTEWDVGHSSASEFVPIDDDEEKRSSPG